MTYTTKISENTGKKVKNAVYFTVLTAFSAAVLLSLLVIIIYVLWRGLPHITPAFLTQSPTHMGKEGGIGPVIIGTVYVTAVALIIAAPVGIGAAMYFTEYAKEGRTVRFIRSATEVLAGVPSILFGLFGFAFFVIWLGLGWSVLSGGLTLCMMILPTIVRSTEESLKAVPAAYREGSLSLGATKWQTIVRVVLPCCKQGILTGIILGVGRAVGETAAVFLTMGGALKLPLSPLDAGRTMSMHMYTLAAEGISDEKAFATAALLIIIILIINAAANFIGNRGEIH
jgi:phosphate transport system permease protein